LAKKQNFQKSQGRVYATITTVQPLPKVVVRLLSVCGQMHAMGCFMFWWVVEFSYRTHAVIQHLRTLLSNPDTWKNLVKDLKLLYLFLVKNINHCEGLDYLWLWLVVPARLEDSWPWLICRNPWLSSEEDSQ
jgi:hypothetical protein